jgi:hypothetical protein
VFDNRAPTPTRTRTGIVAEISDDRKRAVLLLADGLLEEVELSGSLEAEIVLGHPVKAYYDDSERLLGWSIKTNGQHGIDYR